jgi:trehalose-phosphatase
VLRELALAPRLLVCCDFDGTISALADEPSAASPVEGAVAALDALSACADTWAAIVSGRALIDLTRLATVTERVHLVGSHGAEFEIGSILAFGPSEGSLLEAIVGQCRELCDGLPGVLVEVKPASVAVHVRRSPRAVATAALTAVLNGPGSLPGVRIIVGKEVLELAVMSADKGSAVDVLRSRWSITGTLFIGDDETDEAAFAVLRAGDLGIKVGEGPTRAAWRLPDPRSVVQLLDRLVTLRHQPATR